MRRLLNHIKRMLWKPSVACNNHEESGNSTSPLNLPRHQWVSTKGNLNLDVRSRIGAWHWSLTLWGEVAIEPICRCKRLSWVFILNPSGWCGRWIDFPLDTGVSWEVPILLPGFPPESYHTPIRPSSMCATNIRLAFWHLRSVLGAVRNRLDYHKCRYGQSTVYLIW